MRFKASGCCVGVLLLRSITVISSARLGRAEANSPRRLHHVRHRDLTTTRPSIRAERLDDRDGTVLTVTSGRRPGAGMASSARDPNLLNNRRLRQTDREGLHSTHGRPQQDCREGNIKSIGRFYIIGHLEPNIPNVGYQSDSAVSVQAEAKARGQRLRGTEESWQRLQPVVECGERAMSLIIRRRRAVQLLLDRENESSVALSKLPPQCGYSVQTTWRDLTLMADYDACHVTQEEDNYVLPLLWRGIPVKMSCPVAQLHPHTSGISSLCCSLYGMTIKVQGQDPAELKINVRGEWTPLVSLAEQCGYVLDTHGAEIVITAPYRMCGITVKDEKYTLSLHIGEKIFTVSCPVSPHEEPPLIHQSLVTSMVQTKPNPEALEAFPWAPPFYLAPPYYPLPTYYHKYLRPDVHGTHNPLTPLSSISDPTFGPQPLLFGSQPHYQENYSHQIPVREKYKQDSVHSSPSATNEREDSSQVYPGLQQKQAAPPLGISEKQSAVNLPCLAPNCPVQTEVSSLQPPSHSFNPYYHYYHHPKIPFPGPPLDPKLGPEVSEKLPSSNSHTLEVSLLSPNVQQSEANSDQLPQSFPDAASHPYLLQATTKSVRQAVAPHIPYPQHYAHRYFYNIPDAGKEENTKLTPLHHNIAAKENLSVIHPFFPSSLLPDHHKYKVNAHINQANADEISSTEIYTAEWIRNPLSTQTDDIKPVLNDEKRLPTNTFSPGLDPVSAPLQQHSSPSNHNPSPILHYALKSLRSADNHVSPTSSEEDTDHLPQAVPSSVHHPSYGKYETTASPTESENDDDVRNGGFHPYYYNLLYQPEVSQDNSQFNGPSDSHHGRMDSLRRAPEAEYPGVPWSLHSPFQSYYTHMIQQHPYAPIEHPGEDESEENLDDVLRESHQAYIHTPSASPCGFGPAFNFCCSYPVKDCIIGQHFVFVVPDSVVEPTVTPPAHLSETTNASCMPQQLTSDPDLYIVPLNGCGVNKHVFGDTVVHVLEVHGLNFIQDHESMQEYPVRLMVECSSSPGSPDEVRLHLMAQPPPPTQSTPATNTVQLRIATDESFTSYHSEAHLPLSSVRGRPLYFEVNLLASPESDLVLLVHSCLAYTHTLYTSWMPIYNRHTDSQLLPSPHSAVSHHIRRIIISSFLPLLSERSSYIDKEGPTLIGDPQVYFLCLTEVCSSAGVCSVSWTNSPNSDEQ